MYPRDSAAGSSRRRENTNRQRCAILDVGDYMQTATCHAQPAIGAEFTSLCVSELELACIDSDTRARAEDVRERNAQDAWQSAPGLMVHEWAHESRAAQ